MLLTGEHPGDHNHQDFPTSTAIRMGGVLQYKWEAYYDTNGRSTDSISLSSKRRGTESTAIRILCNTNWRCVAILFWEVVVVGALSGQAIRTPTFRRFARIDSQQKTYFWSTWPDSHESRLLSDSHWNSRDSRPFLAAIHVLEGWFANKKKGFSSENRFARTGPLSGPMGFLTFFWLTAQRQRACSTLSGHL